MTPSLHHTSTPMKISIRFVGSSRAFRLWLQEAFK